MCETCNCLSIPLLFVWLLLSLSVNVGGWVCLLYAALAVMIVVIEEENW